jgi:hypothetical protein
MQMVAQLQPRKTKRGSQVQISTCGTTFYAVFNKGGDKKLDMLLFIDLYSTRQGLVREILPLREVFSSNWFLSIRNSSEQFLAP